MIISLLFLIFSNSSSYAQWDARVGFNTRTYPIGAQANATGGYNFLLWDRTDAANGMWKYGYARLGTNLATSAVVNRAGLELQVFPVSLFGITAGYDSGLRNYTPKYLNCSQFECNGRMDRHYLRGNLYLGHHGFTFAGMVRYENLQSFNSAKPFFDELTLLVGRSSGEHVLTYNPAIFYTLDDQFKVGAMSLYSRALDTGNDSHLFGPLVSWSKDARLNLVAGLGLDRSPVVHTGWCGFAVISYALYPSLSITDVALRKETVLYQ